MRLKRCGWVLLVSLALTLGWTSAAQSASIDVQQMKNAKLIELPGDVVLIKQKNKQRNARAVLQVFVAPGEEMSADVTVVKRNKRRRTSEIEFEEGNNTLAFRKARKMIVAFSSSGTPVPEPTTGLMLALGLGGLAYAGRRRS